LSRGPLLRALLLRLGADEHVLVWNVHHIVTDGWSLGILVEELSSLYGAFSRGLPSPLPELPIQYVDYAAWQRRWLAGETLARELSFWKETLAGAPPSLDLPMDRPRPSAQAFRGALETFAFPAGTAAGLRGLASRQSVTLFMVLTGLLGTLLHRASGQEDLVLGTPTAGRSRREIEKLIGLFVNTLALRLDLSGSPSFRGLLGRVREVVLDAQAYEDLPFEKLIEELGVARDMSLPPLFQVMLVLQTVPPVQELPGLGLSLVEADSGTAKFDLTFSWTETAEHLAGAVEYNTDLFDRTTIQRMLGHLRVLLDGALADPDQRISSLPLLSAAERAQIVEWNATERISPEPDLLHEIFAAQAARAPEAEAVVFEDRSLTYGELDAAANRWARHLRAKGVGPEVLVGVSLERSIEQIVALLAILKAGGAYVPLDPDHPAERLAFVLEETGAPLVLTQGSWEEVQEESSAPLAVEVSPDNLVYVIYTSGSTGRPKGAMLTHRGIRNRLLWGLDQQLGPGRKRVLYKTPLSFDVSVWEIFAPLLHGSTLVIARPGAQGDSAYLADLIREQRVTHADFVPSLLQVFLEEPGVGEGSTLERITSAGEA
ncbi:MAG: non-ribosomal peptide synthetase, partial [Thermoanaerobaculia bacterium]